MSPGRTTGAERRARVGAPADSERWLRQAERLANLGRWDWHMATNRLGWSDEVFQIFGRDPAHFRPTVESFEASIHPDDRAAFIAERERSLREGDDVRIEHRIVRPDGSVRHVLELAEFERDPAGTIVHVRGTVQDITDRKEVERALEESHRLLEERVAERTEELAALKHVSRRVSRDLRLSEMVRSCLAVVVRTLGADMAMLSLREGGELKVLHVHRKEGLLPYTPPPPRAVGDCLCGLAARGTAIYSTDLRCDPRRRHGECAESGMSGFAALPLIACDEVIGVLCLASQAPRDFGRRSDFLETLAQDISIALRNSLLYEQSHRHAEALRRREREFEALVENSPDVIMRFDRACRHLYVNQAVRRVDGREPREWVGRTHRDLGYPEDLCRYFETTIERVYRTGQTAHEEFELDGPEGRLTLDWRLIPERAVDGSIETVLSIARDVTRERDAEADRRAAQDDADRERSQAVDAIRSAEQRFRMLIEHSPDGLALNGRDGVMMYHSPSVERILGFKPEDLCGRNSVDFIHPEDAPRIVGEVLPAVLAHPGENVHVRLRMRHKAGGWRHLDAVASNFLGVPGIDAIAINYRDITAEVEEREARRRAEEELAAQRTQAVRADRLRSLGEMAAGIAHELNQPLGGIRALAEQNLIALRRQWAIDPGELEKELQLLVDQSDRMSHIINHVRLFAREAGRPEVRPTDMNEVIEGSVGLVREQWRSRGIALALDLTRPLPPVQANPFSMEEVLLNLLSNARDATEAARGEGAAATVRVRSRVARIDGREWVCVEVRDEGAGIAPDVLSRVFDPFFTTKPPDRGTGLGLPIARAIVGSFGGRIAIETPPEGGAVATVLLPSGGVE